MSSERRTLVLPVLLMTVGVGWLLATLGIWPDVHWPWILSLAAVGLLAFVVEGCDKVTVVVGPFFLVASVLSILRQTGRLDLDVEFPILVILVGFLMLVARSPRIPLPKWILEDPKRPDSNKT